MDWGKSTVSDFGFLASGWFKGCTDIPGLWRRINSILHSTERVLRAFGTGTRWWDCRWDGGWFTMRWFLRRRAVLCSWRSGFICIVVNFSRCIVSFLSTSTDDQCEAGSMCFEGEKLCFKSGNAIRSRELIGIMESNRFCCRRWSDDWMEHSQSRSCKLVRIAPVPFIDMLAE